MTIEMKVSYDYINELFPAVEFLRVPDGWKMSYDPMAGSWYLYRDDVDYVVYCTPWWEGNEGITFALQDEGDGYVVSSSHRIDPTMDKVADAFNIVQMISSFLKSDEFSQLVAQLRRQ